MVELCKNRVICIRITLKNRKKKFHLRVKIKSKVSKEGNSGSSDSNFNRLKV